MSRPALVEAERSDDREALDVLIRALRYMAPFRGRFAIKLTLTLVTFLPMLVLPWPVKVLIDHVINGEPVDPSTYPFFLAPVAHAMVGVSPEILLVWVVVLQALLLISIGALGSDGGERDRTEGYVASGHDTATSTENAANSGFSFSGGLLGLFDFGWTMRLTQDLNHHYRASLFRRIAELPLHVFDDERIGDAVYRLMYDTPSITQACYRTLLVPTLVPIGIAIWSLTLWHTYDTPILAGYALGLVPLVLLATWPFGAWLRRQGTRSRQAGATTTASLEEGMANIVAVQSLGGQDREKGRFEGDSERSFARHRGVLAVGMLAILVAAVPVVGVLAAAFLHTVDLVIDGTLSVGDFTVVFTYFGQLVVFAVLLGSYWFALQTAAPGLQRVFFLMDLPDESDPPGAVDLPRVRRGLKIEDVDFDYPDGTSALREITLEARVGQVTALVGSAGAGKTTLAWLVPRFLSPTRGRVTLDGVDLQRVTLDSLRSQIAFVFQESQLFQGTVEENIRMGRPEASDVEVRRAARTAGADEFIAQLPDGYATRLGRGGAGLSVGQKQRVAIARALLRDAPILILDEPTSALDPDTERRLVEALHEAARERMVLVIAHRLSTIRAADQIIVLDHGRIVERGHHAELMARPDGAYRHLAEIQQAG